MNSEVDGSASVGTRHLEAAKADSVDVVACAGEPSPDQDAAVIEKISTLLPSA
jgi:hypothetical protein